MYVIVSKTSSVFNRSLSEMNDIKKVLAIYLREAPWIGEYPTYIVSNFPNAYYSPYQKQFVFGIFNSAIMAHEIEHALSTHDSKMYTHLLAGSKAISNLLGPLIPVLLGQGSKVLNPDSTETVNKAYETLSALKAITSAPTLYEEGKANINAARHLPNKMEVLKTLGPAYSTYVAGTAMPVAAYQLFKSVGNKN
jgi:hypothetical protein